jgi:hypothetical protein
VKHRLLTVLLVSLPLVLPAATRTLRYENIRDDEVREIQHVMARIEPGAIVDIDSVYEGCACTEGAQCTDQVWVVSHRPGRDAGVWLSKVEGHWALGAWEQWERDWQALLSRRYEIIGQPGPGYKERQRQYYERVQALQDAKPVCAGVQSADAGTNGLTPSQFCPRRAASCSRR